jgi:hypothetical protein
VADPTSSELNFAPPTGPRLDIPRTSPEGFSSGSGGDVWSAPSGPRPSLAAAPPAPPLPLAPLAFPGQVPGFSPWVNPADPNVAILDVPGASVPVYIVGVNTGQPRLFIGDRPGKVASFSNGKVFIPMSTGGRSAIKWAEPIPGYPVVKHDGREIYRLPKPALGDRFTIVTTRVVPFLIGIIPGWFIGLALARWVSGMVKRGESIAQRRVLPLFLAFSGTLFAVVLEILYFATVGSRQRY